MVRKVDRSVRSEIINERSTSRPVHTVRFGKVDNRSFKSGATVKFLAPDAWFVVPYWRPTNVGHCCAKCCRQDESSHGIYAVLTSANVSELFFFLPSWPFGPTQIETLYTPLVWGLSHIRVVVYYYAQQNRYILCSVLFMSCTDKCAGAWRWPLTPF